MIVLPSTGEVTEVLFRKASLVELDGYQRLSLPSLETWSAAGRPSLAEAGVDWAQRLATHCHYLADKVIGQTSSGP